jgi:hypothetical protein
MGFECKNHSAGHYFASSLDLCPSVKSVVQFRERNGRGINRSSEEHRDDKTGSRSAGDRTMRGGREDTTEGSYSSP